MPYRLSTFKLPCGRPCGRADGSGLLTPEEADAALQTLAPGGQLHGLPLLVQTLEVETVTPGARRAFGHNAHTGWVAIVAPNPVLRVAVNFVLRITRNPRQRMFATEEEAIRWLDERAREDAEKAKPGRP